MELSAFSENIVTRSFTRSGQSLELQVNIDVVTPEFLDAIQSRLDAIEKKATTLIKNEAKRAKKAKAENLDLELEKNLLILQREANASFLCDPIPLPDGSTTSLLRGWNMTDQGNPVECNKENVCRLPPKGVEALTQFCLRVARTVKKTDDGAESSESMQDGSQPQNGTLEGLRLVGQAT